MMYRRIMLACSLRLGWPVPSSAKYRSAVNWASTRFNQDEFVGGQAISALFAYQPIGQARHGHGRTRPAGPLEFRYQSDIIFMGGRVTDTAGDRRHPDARTQRQHSREGPARVEA